MGRDDQIITMEFHVCKVHLQKMETFSQAGPVMAEGRRQWSSTGRDATVYGQSMGRAVVEEEKRLGQQPVPAGHINHTPPPESAPHPPGHLPCLIELLAGETAGTADSTGDGIEEGRTGELVQQVVREAIAGGAVHRSGYPLSGAAQQLATGYCAVRHMAAEGSEPVTQGDRKPVPQLSAKADIPLAGCIGSSIDVPKIKREPNDADSAGHSVVLLLDSDDGAGYEQSVEEEGSDAVAVVAGIGVATPRHDRRENARQQRRLPGRFIAAWQQRQGGADLGDAGIVGKVRKKSVQLNA
jgi:hypothetical protein